MVTIPFNGWFMTLFYPLHEIQDGFDVGWAQHVSTIFLVFISTSAVIMSIIVCPQ